MISQEQTLINFLIKSFLISVLGYIASSWAAIFVPRIRGTKIVAIQSDHGVLIGEVRELQSDRGALVVQVAAIPVVTAVAHHVPDAGLV